MRLPDQDKDRLHYRTGFEFSQAHAKLLLTGMNMARVNFSQEFRAHAQTVIANLRQAARVLEPAGHHGRSAGTQNTHRTIAAEPVELEPGPASP